MLKYITFIIALTTFLVAGYGEGVGEDVVDKEIIAASGAKSDSTESGEGVAIPDEFPSDVPIYVPSKVISVEIIPDEFLPVNTIDRFGKEKIYIAKKSGYQSIELLTTDGMERVFKSYINKLEAQGWELGARSVEIKYDDGQPLPSSLHYDKGQRYVKIHLKVRRDVGMGTRIKVTTGKVEVNPLSRPQNR